MTYGLKRQWKIHLIHHTHLDIGYTHTQENVLQIQYGHLEQAMDLVDQHRSKPDPSRFRWNPEITWALDTWVKQATPENLSRFVGMVKEGYIGIDALYGNLLTGLCRPEEIMAGFTVKQELEALTGKKINSAMITDVPGWNWGFVKALSLNGIQYLSAGTNRSDRIGHILKQWADKPFYWISEDGSHKVLTWVHGKGYSWFHSGLKKRKNLSRKLTPPRISKYLRHLEKEDFPYSTVIIRYNIGQDNGPPDHNISDIIAMWNKTYTNMQITLSTTASAMADFEADYGHLLERSAGDLTPYWEDGAASTARETALARDASERLIQTAALSKQLGIPLDEKRVQQTFKQILLYNEHTWGAYNSISKPDDDFAKTQWAYKRDFAINSSRDTYQLLNEILDGRLMNPLPYMSTDIYPPISSNKSVQTITVYNTHPWPVSQLITIPAAYNMVKDQNGQLLMSQSLSNGHLAFFVNQIPAEGSISFELSFAHKASASEPRPVSLPKIRNSHLSLTVNEENGTINSLIYKDKEFIKPSIKEAFNQYIYASGKWGTKRLTHHPKNLEIKLLEDGPVLTRIQIQSEGYHTNLLTTTLTIVEGSNRLYIENMVDRPIYRRKEGLYFEFPLNLPDGQVRYDTLFGTAIVDQDQLPGANRNFITATRWVDISDENMGLSLALLDAPIYKSGALIHDPVRSGNPTLCGWLKETHFNGTLYSYVMNNYWMTNYKADQPGNTLFRYVFMPHRTFIELETNRFALEEAQPLIIAMNK